MLYESKGGGPGLEPLIVKRKADPFKDATVKDKHVYGQNWSWDYVMTFDVGTEQMIKEQEGNSTDAKFIQEHTLAKIIAKLAKGGLETKMFYSQDRTIIFLKIRASLERFCAAADFENYKLRMEDTYVREKLAAGKLSDDENSFVWKPKAYSDALLAKAEDDAWSQANYHRGEGLSDNFEYMIITADDGENALLPEGKKKILGKVMPIKDDFQQCKFKYYEYHYGPYDDEYAMDGPKGMYKRDLKSNSPFRGVDRLKLLLSIFETPLNDKGCGLDIGKLIQHDCIKACFPLHDEDDVIALQNNMLAVFKWPWQMEYGVEKIREYFGEKIGLYFKFVCCYTTHLSYAAKWGSVAYLFVCLEQGGVFGSYRTHGSSIAVLPATLYMCLWVTNFTEDWKTIQVESAMKWGMAGFEDNEQKERAEFKINPENIMINNPVDGTKYYYFPEEKKKKRIWFSYSIISILIFFVVFFVMLVFGFKSLVDPNQCVRKIVVDDEADDAYGEFEKGEVYGKPTMLCIDSPWNKIAIPPAFGITPELPLGPGLAAIINSVNILIFNFIYGRISKVLNEMENHRTDIEFEDALIIKTFTFQMVNSYGALAYIAFIKEPIVNRLPFVDIYALCPYEFKEAGRGRSCFTELGVQLNAIFVIKFIVDNLIAVIVPYLFYPWSASGDNDDEGELDDPDVEGGQPPMKRLKSLVELEFDREEYDVLMGPFGDYGELVIQFGYATMFFTAFPMAPLMAFLSNLMQIRMDLYKLCQLHRRAEPRSNEDIGSWQSILDIIGMIAVVSNSALIVFTSGYLKDYQHNKAGSFHALDSSPTDDEKKSRSVQGYKWLLFFLLEHSLILGKMLIDLISDDVPGDVEIQLARQKLIQSKLILNQESEGESDEDSEHEDPLISIPNKHIHQFDEDIILKSHAEEEYRARLRFAKAQGLEGAMEEIGEPEKSV